MPDRVRPCAAPSLPPPRRFCSPAAPPRRASPPRRPPRAPTYDQPTYQQITPAPADATDDLPPHYAQGCQAKPGGSALTRCDHPTPGATLTVAIIGDSKIAQWVTPIHTIAQQHGWNLRTYTKSTCPFADATTTRGGKPYTDCDHWNHAVHADLSDDPVDVVITSSVRAEALDDGTLTADALTAGYTTTWNTLADDGTQVIAVSDTPYPHPLGQDAYECVAATDDLDDCAWPYRQPDADHAMQTAAARAENATYLDLNALVCPDGTCPAVRDNILTFHSGSHITDTYADWLTGDVAEKVVPLVEGR